MKRIATIAIGMLSLAALGLSASAQNQDQNSGSNSLGDYARQVRKSPANGAKPKVFDNDNLPTQDKLSIIGPGPSASSSPDSSAAKPADSGNTSANTSGADAKAPEVKPPSDKPVEGAARTQASEQKAPGTASAESGAPKTGEQDDADKQAAWKQWGDRINSQKEQVDLLTRELDVLQREYQIRAAAMYADAGNRLRNQTDWDKQDAQYKQQIADKQKALDEAKQKMEDLQEEARKAGVPSSVRE
ncbi:MAG TPA: hypothetical protein VKV39_06180 [Candidatus Sulfotelmatobacter sp.]|nr:hypothetical protein [Candidatus Sulfotelmatobacter sp.]